MYSITSSICFGSINTSPSCGQWIRQKRQAGEEAEEEVEGGDLVERSCITESAIGLWFEKLPPSPHGPAPRILLFSLSRVPQSRGGDRLPTWGCPGQCSCFFACFCSLSRAVSRELEMGSLWRQPQLSAESFFTGWEPSRAQTGSRSCSYQTGGEVSNLTFFDSDL